MVRRGINVSDANNGVGIAVLGLYVVGRCRLSLSNPR